MLMAIPEVDRTKVLLIQMEQHVAMCKRAEEEQKLRIQNELEESRRLRQREKVEERNYRLEQENRQRWKENDSAHGGSLSLCFFFF